jgi:hypothetical protein
MVNGEFALQMNLKTDNQYKLTIDHSYHYTNALNPVIDLPTIKELISFVPS